MPKKGRPARFEIFQSERGDWCWHLVAASGRIQADGAGFSSRSNAKRAVIAVIKASAKAKIVLL